MSSICFRIQLLLSFEEIMEIIRLLSEIFYIERNLLSSLNVSTKITTAMVVRAMGIEAPAAKYILLHPMPGSLNKRNTTDT